MIIVSQDKKQVVNIDNITRVFIEKLESNEFGIGADTNSVESQVWDLGYYKTEERAKKVLEGIIKSYEKAGNIIFKTDESERLMRLTHNSNVFEMPEE